MKNISRRVFIKGMAVAAAATAASTVLTGCKLPVGTEETPVVGFQPTTKTLTYGENTLKITTTSCETTADDYIKVGVTIINEMDENVYVYNDLNTAARLNVSAYFDGKHVATSIETDNTLDKNLYSGSKYLAYNDEKSGVTSTYTHEGYLYFKPTNEDWKTMTLAFVMKGADENNKESTQEAQIVINK